MLLRAEWVITKFPSWNSCGKQNKNHSWNALDAVFTLAVITL
jgi:hypothetical protein